MIILDQSIHQNSLFKNDCHARSNYARRFSRICPPKKIFINRECRRFARPSKVKLAAANALLLPSVVASDVTEKSCIKLAEQLLSNEAFLDKIPFIYALANWLNYMIGLAVEIGDQLRRLQANSITHRRVLSFNYVCQRLARLTCF